MSKFETEMKRKLEYIPKYVDDVFAIFNAKQYNVKYFM